MSFWQTTTFKNLVLAGVSAALGLVLADIADGTWGWQPYAALAVGTAIGIVNRARQPDVEGFPTVTVGGK